APRCARPPGPRPRAPCTGRFGPGALARPGRCPTARYGSGSPALLLVVDRRPGGAAADCTLGPMRVLIAPDKFRGTLTAAQAAHAVASGWRRARPGDTIVEVPMADGGEGTLDALVEALDGVRHRAKGQGPLGDPVAAGDGIVSGP